MKSKIFTPGTFHAHGKLLLTAEYFVLDGALALALPVKFGQTLSVEIAEKKLGETLSWQSFDENGKCWFSAVFGPKNFDCIESTDVAVAARLQKILLEAQKLNRTFRLRTANCQLRTHLTFPRQWGLGTSSTLVYLIAQWAKVDPFELQFRTFGGSGYDIACAGADGPVLYKLENGKPQVERCKFQPPFAKQLYFVYLGKKQDSGEGIARYRNRQSTVHSPQSAAGEVSALSRAFLEAGSLEEFEELIRRHEAVVAGTLGLSKAKDLYFKDFWGEIKSLGAWGGDFVLATSNRPEEETRRYFNERGFEVFLPYKKLVS